VTAPASGIGRAAYCPTASSGPQRSRASSAATRRIPRDQPPRPPQRAAPSLWRRPATRTGSQVGRWPTTGCRAPPSRPIAGRRWPSRPVRRRAQVRARRLACSCDDQPDTAEHVSRQTISALITPIPCGRHPGRPRGSLHTDCPVLALGSATFPVTEKTRVSERALSHGSPPSFSIQAKRKPPRQVRRGDLPVTAVAIRSAT
jgi:hypothetical protein